MRKVGLWSWLEKPGSGDVYKPVGRPEAQLKRVAIDLTPVLPGGQNGGAKVMTVELIRNMALLAPHCEFLLLTAESSHDELSILDAPNVQRICVVKPSQSSPGLMSGGRKLLSAVLPEEKLQQLAGLYREVENRSSKPTSAVLEGLGVDLLFCPFTAPFFAEPGIPVVSVVYDLQHVYYPQFFEPHEIEERDRNFRRMCRVAAKVICISDYVRQTVLDNSELPEERVHTVHILLPNRLEEPLEPVRTRVLASLGLKPERFLLYPSNFWPHKNHEVLLTAFGMYRAANPDSDLKLVLTGTPGTRRDALMAAANRMGLAQSVLFPGYLTNEDLAVLFYGCTALVFPSLFEGFGMPLLEAMAAGKAILSSNVTSLPEVAGDAALLFDPRKPSEIMQAITKLEQDVEFRHTLAGKSQRRLSAFGDANDMARQYLSLIQQAVTEAPNLQPGLYGIFEDGWIGEKLTIAFEGAPSARTLTVMLSVPPWAPTNRITVTVRSASGSNMHAVGKGQTETIQCSLPDTAGTLDLVFAPAFRPKACGIADDLRALTCHFEGASIINAEGKLTEIEPRTYAA
jgi:glycosyltransferase involved in cell wall biosynthesis